MKYHNPVLIEECVKGLNINPEGVYVDVTFGGGGHSKLILKNLKGGKLYAFDKDNDALANKISNDNFKLINADFRHLRNFLRMEGVLKIDGLLADLGVSSHQFDVAERGFSIRFNGKLDMRMNTKSNLSARNIINNYSKEELSNILFKYGELRNSRSIAQKIIVARSLREIATTNQLKEAVEHMVPRSKRNQFLARIFQAIRIEVNDEMDALEEMLLDAVEMLNVGGRLVVLSYHSLEDRMIKNLINKGNTKGKLDKDFYGNPITVMNGITRKPLIASISEINNNERSRSAKLRIGEKK
jgi:16S rRNA (cytosine1402-N4)-methyltransferase